MQMRMLNRNGALVLGLCALVTGCGDVLQAGDTYGSSHQMEELSPDSAPEPGAPEGPAPDSVEYETAKMALVGTPTPGSEEAEDPLDKSLDTPAIAIVQDLGCQARSLGRSDDGSTARITLPFSINLFGTTQNSVFINNNGNITFNSALSSFTPFTINSRTPPIIAPFFADVDTRNTASGIVQFSDAPILFDGRQAFCVSWGGVGYYSSHADKLNSFQLLLVDRSDTGAGNFDVVMNYDQIRWETGDADGGTSGLGGTSAGAGISSGNGDTTAFFQVPGSLVRSGLLDSNATTGLSRTSHFSTVPGRHVFAVRGGKPVTDERITLAPAVAVGQEGRSHTVTATLANDRGTPLANRAVTFRILSGPNANLPPIAITSNASGQASFTYTGAGGVGQDQIQAAFVKTSGQAGSPEVATINWLRAPRPPVAVCRNVVVVANNTCRASASVENGSFDPDGDLVACTQRPGPVFGIGANLVTLTCTDRAGLTGSCTGMVTIQDTTAPVISCPSNQTAECVAGAATVNVPNATGSDLCGSVIVTGPAGTGSFSLGSTSLTFSAADESGNTASCTTNVTVVDTIAPVITCAAPITAECTANTSAPVDVPNATASDLCGGVAVTGPAGTGAFPLGTTALSFGARDGAGHTAGCATSVTVVDTTRPTLTCAQPVIAECTGNHAASVDVPTPAASDACSSVEVTGPAGTRSFPTGTTTVGFTAVDTSGNTATCTSEVTVADTAAPAITCAAPITTECTGNRAATVDVPAATATDVCGGAAVAGPAGAASYPLGTTAVGFSATDDAGNLASCATTVTVADTTRPVFDPASLGAQTVLGSCDGAPVRFTLPAATDACQAVAVTCTPLPGDSLGANTVTCTATDGSGNHTEATITVNVLPPLRLAFQAPLSDDNVADDIERDADVANVFEVKRTIPNQIKVFACSGADVTTAIAGSVTLRLTTSFRDDTSNSAGTAIVPSFTGVGDAGGVFVLTGDHFQYNQKTDATTYPSGSINNSHYFENIVTLTYNAAPSIVAGQEDVRLESK
jgi:hypothetical protein